MASQSEIDRLRSRTGETIENLPDDAAGDLIDEHGLDAATVIVLQDRAARLSSFVDVTDTGTSRKMSQAFDQVQKLLDYWEDQAGVKKNVGAARVRKIQRPFGEV